MKENKAHSYSSKYIDEIYILYFYWSKTLIYFPFRAYFSAVLRM